MLGSLNAMWGACSLYEESLVSQKNRSWLHKELLAPASRGYELGRGSHMGKPKQTRPASTAKTQQNNLKKTPTHKMLSRGWLISSSTFFACVFGEDTACTFSSGHWQWRGLMQAEPRGRRRSGETVVMKGWQNRTGELPEALNHSKPKQRPSLFKGIVMGFSLRSLP